MQLHTNKSKKRRYFIIAAVIFATLVIAWVSFVILNNSKKDTESINTTASSSETSQSSSVSSTSNSSGPVSSTSNSNTETAPSVDSSVTPIAPSGTFISSHHLSLSSGYTINSTCSTTPGATCTVMFTQGNTVRSLDTIKSDANGNVSWTWTLKDIGLTTGDWKVSATAANGNKTSTASDSLPLEVTE